MQKVEYISGYDPGLPADVAQTELHRIRDRKGTLTPAIVVEVARNPRNPLHKVFLWDDTDAANRYRLRQASALIRSIRVVYKRKDPQTKKIRTVRARENIRTTTEDGQADYASIADVVKDPTLYQQERDRLQKSLMKYQRMLDTLALLAKTKDQKDSARLAQDHVQQAVAALA